MRMGLSESAMLPGGRLHSMGPLYLSEACAIGIVSSAEQQNVYVWNHTDYFIRSLFLMNITVSLVNRMDFAQHSELGILAISGTFDQLRKFNYLSVYSNPLSVIAVLDGTFKEGENLIFMFWSLNIYNITAIVNGILLKSVHMRCGNYKIVNFGNCASPVDHILEMSEEGCSFRVNWVNREPFFIGTPRDGIEYILLALIIKALSLNAVWHREKNFGFFVNGTWTDALGNLEDLAAGGFMISAKKLGYFHMTYPHFYDNYKWFGPISTKKRIWLSLSPFGLGSHFLIMIFMGCCLSLFSDNERMFSTPSLCFLNVFRAALGQPIRKTPKKTPVRLVFISWVCYQMILNGILSGLLVKNLTSKVERETIPDLQRMTCLSPEVEAETGVPVEPCDILKLSRRLVNYNNFTVLAANDPMRFVSEKDRLPIRSAGRAFHPIYNTFILPKDSNYYGRINKLVSLAFESGLIKKITADVRERYTKKVVAKVSDSVLDITLTLALHSIGCTIAFVAFIIELKYKSIFHNI